MARKFLKSREKEIRGLVVEKIDTGIVEVYKNFREFDLIKEDDNTEITKVFKIKSHQEEKIKEILFNNNGTIEGVELLTIVIPMLTDIDFSDIDFKKDKDVVEDIINNPDEVLKGVLGLVNLVLIEYMNEMKNTIDVLEKIPEQTLGQITEEQRRLQQLKELEQKRLEEKKQKQREEMDKIRLQMAELEKKAKELENDLE